MLGKSKRQRGFSDFELSGHTTYKQFLGKLDQGLDWEPIKKLLESLFTAKTGRPSHPPLLMFKALLLAQWYRLSDPLLEEAVNDRVSFRQFLGLPLGAAAPAPDETSFCRFRQLLEERGLMPQVWELLNRQLEAKGLQVNRGTIIDATLVQAAPRPPAKTAEPKDPEASWTVRLKGPHYGFKAHIGVRQVELTTAAVHDSQVFEVLLSGDEAAVFADKAYCDQERTRQLRAQDIFDGILEKGYRHQPLSPQQEQRNKNLSRVRSGVERIFGTVKRTYGWSRVRYLGLRKNRLHLYLLAMAYNLKRILRLSPQFT